MGVHTGVAEERDGDYFGPVLNRCARLMSAGHGGQVLLSNATAQLVGRADLVDLGEQRLKDLSAPERIWQVGAGRHPPLRTLDRQLHNLAVQRTELIGRKALVDEIAVGLGSARLVSLLGIGGTGKTRLALGVAAEVMERFDDGVWFVDLVPVADAQRLPEAIADAVGLALAGSGDATTELGSLLAQRNVLLVLDNCEHLTDPVAELTDRLLDATQHLRFLVTSREPLDLPDEQQVHVPPLDVDDDLQAPAVALFAAAAGRVGVTIGAGDVGVVVHICRQLDGLPLALELAAAQLRSLTLIDLSARLDHRFELLGRERRGSRQRQASLFGVLQDTWEMLSGEEQELLSQLAAFPSSFDVDAVEAVCAGREVGVPARTLSGLVDRSLVAVDGTGRLRLLETVKLFTQRNWGSDADYRDRHTNWCLQHLRAFPYEARHTSLTMVGWASNHYDDLRAAEDHLASSDRTAELVELLGLQSYTLSVSGAARGAAVIDRIERYLSHLGLDPVEAGILQLVAAGAGLSARRPDWIAAGSADAIISLRLAGRAEDLAAALHTGSWMMALRDTDAALERLDEALAIADGASALAMANSIRAYQANHLTVAGRLGDAKGVLADLFLRLADTPYDYARHNFYLVSAAAWIIDEPDQSVAAMSAIRTASQQAGFPYGAALLVCEAVAAASVGDIDRTFELLDQTREGPRTGAATTRFPTFCSRQRFSHGGTAIPIWRDGGSRSFGTQAALLSPFPSPLCSVKSATPLALTERTHSNKARSRGSSKRRSPGSNAGASTDSPERLVFESLISFT